MSLDKENHNYDDPKKVSGLTVSNDVSVGGFLNLNGLSTTKRPSNPLLGATYFDSSLNQVFIYTPTGWRGMFLGSAPAAPTIGTVTTSGLTASVPFSAPSDTGGSAITSYIVTSSPGNITATGTSSPITVPGLALNTAYTFRVAGVNVFGVGTSSAASNQVFPVPPTVTGGDLTSDSQFYYRTFTSSGTLGVANSPLVADVLVVGGGGGGGISGDRSSGGGGAGGVTYSPQQTFVANQTVTVGAGGPAGGSGFPSSLGSISAAAGGQGGGSGSYTILSTTNVGSTITLTLNTTHNLKVGNQITPLGIAAANSSTFTVNAVAASTPSTGFAQYTTSTTHGFQVGWLVFVAGASVAGYNVSGAIITSIPSPTTFVVRNFTVGAATFSGGTVVANYAGNTVSNAVTFETAQISSITNSSNVVTVALTVNHGFNLGDTVQIVGSTATTNAPNGNWIISNIVNSTTFQVVVAAAPTGTIVTTTASIQSPSYNYAGRIPFAITAVPASNQVTYVATATPTGAFTNPSGSMGVSGGNGGSGGGGNHNGQGNLPGTGIVGQGFRGGGGYDSAIGVFGAGGGGGAGGVGAPGDALGGGNGGGGTSAFVSWLPITALGFNGYIAGGGGGAGQTLTAYMSGLVGVTLTNSGTTVTGTTAAPHGLTAGQTIRISFAGATTNAPNGNWVVATTPTTTTFTFSVLAAPTGTITGAELGTPTASFTFSGNTVTCTTPAPHGMIAGQRVSVYATTATTNPPNGNWVVASIVSGTQFTFNVFSAPSGTISNGIVVCPGEGVVAGTGGIGGGGNGGASYPVNGANSFTVGQNGVANTGGGGGGASGINSPSSALGVSYSGTGGSGLVVVRYARSQIGG